MASSRQERNAKFQAIRAMVAAKKEQKKELSDIEKTIDFAYHYGYAEAMVNTMFALHDKYGWGHDRLLFLMNYLEDFHADYGRPGIVTIDDKVSVLKEECDLNIDPVEMEIIGQHYWTRGTATEVIASSGKRTVKDGVK